MDAGEERGRAGRKRTHVAAESLVVIKPESKGISGFMPQAVREGGEAFLRLNDRRVSELGTQQCNQCGG